MMKKLLSLLLCLSMLCMAASALAYTPGSYTASGNGLMGPVEVTVTFDETAITEILVGAHTETAGICDAAIEKVPAAIIAGQTVAVDAASGATFSSQAIIDAVADCVAQAGGDVAAMQSAGASAPAAEDEVLTYDVVVVGGGAAGIGAAANAKDAGASVLLIEKQGRMGGNTIISGGLIYATGTSFQAEAGVEDSVEALVDYWYTRAEGNADRDFLTLVAEKSNETIEWLQEGGVVLGGLSTSGISQVPRMLSAGIR